MLASLCKLSLTAAVLMFAAPTVAEAQAKASRKPNIIVIVGDDMGYGDIGIHGCKDIPTPHIDSIAKNGLRATSGYVSGPYCSPTRAGLLTGRYQNRFGHEFNPGPAAKTDFGLSLRETTLAARLRQAGYTTALIGKWHLGFGDKFHPLERGFSEFFGFLGGAHPYVPGKGPAILRGKQEIDEKEYLTDALKREAVDFVQRHKDQPYFLYLAFNAVHLPLQASEKDTKRFAAIEDEKRRTYAAMMSSMDDAIGALLEKLRETGQEENTLIFFISDNGGPLANGSSNGLLRGVKATTWEGGIRVPWLAQWKGQIPAGKTFDQPIIQLDIAPTALAAAGIDIPADAKFDGVNLLPHFQGKASTPPHDALFWRFGKQTAIRKGDWSYVEANGSNGKLLFNLRDDIGQTKDISAANPEVVRDLQAAWDEWNKSNVPAAWQPAGKAKKN